jgi:hypothetical protein
VAEVWQRDACGQTVAMHARGAVVSVPVRQRWKTARLQIRGFVQGDEF